MWQYKISCNSYTHTGLSVCTIWVEGCAVGETERKFNMNNNDYNIHHEPCDRVHKRYTQINVQNTCSVVYKQRILII